MRISRCPHEARITDIGFRRQILCATSQSWHNCIQRTNAHLESEAQQITKTRAHVQAHQNASELLSEASYRAHPCLRGT